MARPWIKLDAAWLLDDRVVDAGAEHGPGAPLLYSAVLCACKRSGSSDGTFTVAIRSLTRETFLENDQHTETLLGHLAALDLVQVEPAAQRRIAVTIPPDTWAKYQRDPSGADRQAASRARRSESVTHLSQTQRDEVVPTETRTKDKERTASSGKPDAASPKRPPTATDLRSRADLTAPQRVFVAWAEATGRHGSRLDDKRRRLIENRLGQAEEADLLDAVRGWRHSPHHRGENTAGTVYNDLGLLLRDVEHIERFAALERQHGAADRAKADEVARLRRLHAAHAARQAGAA